MQLRARMLLSQCGICDWNMQSSETVWCACRQSRSWREKCGWKFLNKTSLGGAARTASHDIGAIYAIENWHFSTNFKEIFRARLVKLLARDVVEKLSIAFFAPISWLVAPATIPRLRQKKLDPFQSQSTSKNFNHMSHAKIVSGDTRNISKRWSTSKNFQSHFSRQYCDWRHSQHLQRLVDIKNFNRISRANIVASGTRITLNGCSIFSIAYPPFKNSTCYWKNVWRQMVKTGLHRKVFQSHKWCM